MDVGHACADGIEHDLLQISDDRRILDFLIRLFIGRTLGIAFLEIDFQVVGSDQILEGLPHDLDNLGDCAAELVVLDNHRIDDQIGLEPHLVERLHVRRIRHRDKKAIAALVQRQYATGRDNLGIDELLVDLVEVETAEIEQRRAERPRRKLRDLRGVHALGKEDLFYKSDVGGFRLTLKRFGVIFRQKTVLDHRPCEAADVLGCRVRCHGEQSW